MKLKHIKTYSQNASVATTFDLYICVEVWIGQDDNTSSLVYWRLVDDTHNLIVIGIDRVSGQLQLMRVVLYKESFAHLDDNFIETLLHEESVIKGVPGFGLSAWREPTHTYDLGSDLVSVPGRCKMALSFDTLYIQLFDDQLTYGVENENLCCLFNNENELCALVIKDLEAENIETLKRYSALRNRPQPCVPQ